MYFLEDAGKKYEFKVNSKRRGVTATFKTHPHTGVADAANYILLLNLHATWYLSISILLQLLQGIRYHPCPWRP